MYRPNGSSLIPGSHDLGLISSRTVQGKNQLLEAVLRLAHIFVYTHTHKLCLCFLDSNSHNQSQNNSPIPFQREIEAAGLGYTVALKMKEPRAHKIPLLS